MTRQQQTKDASAPASFKIIAVVVFVNGILAAFASFLLLLGGEGALRFGGLGLLISGIGLVRGGVDLLARRRSALLIFRVSIALTFATFIGIALSNSHHDLAGLELLGVVGLVIFVIYAGTDVHIRQELDRQDRHEKIAG
ncbi:MAG: hypothetical protein WD672_04490 [Woeseia sp.]